MVRCQQMLQVLERTEKVKTVVSGHTSLLMPAAFLTLLFLSGFCGISYEILYARILGNLVGDQFTVSASTLLSFLLGMGFGAFYACRWWPFLWLVEAGIGLCGVAFALGNPALGSWLYSSGLASGSNPAGSMLVCCTLLGLPSFLVGCSLPLFAGYLGQLSSGQVFAKAYTFYNFGAALTALLIEFWLLRILGLRNTLLAVAALNFLVSIGLLAGFAPLRATQPAPAERAPLPLNHGAALALASIASAVFQLLMIKITECLFGPFRETFGFVVSVVLLGIALGSALTEKYRLSFEQALFANLGGLAWLLGGFGLVSRYYAAYHPAMAGIHFLTIVFKLFILVLLMGLPAVSFGATIPALLGAQKDVARESGRLLSLSCLANAAGFMLMAFFLHQYFDYGVLVLIVAILTGASLVVFCQGRRIPALRVLASLVVIAGLHRVLWDENLLYLGHTAFDSAPDLKTAKGQMVFPEKFKGHQDVFSILRMEDQDFFFINGFISIPLNSPAEKIVGAFSSLFAPRTDRALVLGVGSGATAGTVTLLFDQTDAVEINPVVLENLHRMGNDNFQMESRPQVKIIEDDAIRFVRRTQGQYSLILNTVTTPLYFSSSKLYTRDFFEMVRQRLTPDGIYVAWFDTRVGDRGADIILKTLSQSFPECWIGCIKSGYFLLICSQQPIVTRQLRLVAGNSELRHYLYHQNGLLPDWLPYGLLSTRAYDLIKDPSVSMNTLDYPALEFEITGLGGREGMDDFLARLHQKMSVDDVATALKPSLNFRPLELALYTDELLGDSGITRQWRTLASLDRPGFDQEFDAARLQYYASYASAADTADAHHRYGYQLLEQDDYPRALQQFKRALELNPKRDNSYFNIGACYERMGQYDLALRNYALERKVDPDDADVSYRMGRVYYKAKRFREALACLDAAAETSERSAPHFYRGLVLEALGNTAEARIAYQKSLTLDFDNEEVLGALARVVQVEP